ncbi:hypothetical protein GCM10009539_17060 [Cryptosporangium japonicum]|uniref:Uncharacterized protein n=1 Tax=Cryptosporangium japonicum TaxID=80872 RepID=A0ABP3DGP8_9ACTN
MESHPSTSKDREDNAGTLYGSGPGENDSAGDRKDEGRADAAHGSVDHTGGHTAHLRSLRSPWVLRESTLAAADHDR